MDISDWTFLLHLSWVFIDNKIKLTLSIVRKKINEETLNKSSLKNIYGVIIIFKYNLYLMKTNYNAKCLP